MRSGRAVEGKVDERGHDGGSEGPGKRKSASEPTKRPRSNTTFCLQWIEGFVRPASSKSYFANKIKMPLKHCVIPDFSLCAERVD